MLTERLYAGSSCEQYVPGGGPLAALKRLRLDLLFGRGARTHWDLCVEERHLIFLEARGLVRRIPECCPTCSHPTGKMTNRWSMTSKGERVAK